MVFDKNHARLTEENWKILSSRTDFSEQFFRKFSNRLYWPEASENQSLSVQFFEENFESCFQFVSYNRSVPQWFFEKYFDRFNSHYMGGIWSNDKLSQDFIERLLRKFRPNIFQLSGNQNISPDFIKFLLETGEYSPRYQAISILRSLYAQTKRYKLEQYNQTLKQLAEHFSCDSISNTFQYLDGGCYRHPGRSIISQLLNLSPILKLLGFFEDFPTIHLAT